MAAYFVIKESFAAVLLTYKQRTGKNSNGEI